MHRQGEGQDAVRVRLQEPAPAKAGVSVATPATKPEGGQFVLHVKALHGNPFDGHTLGPVVTELEALTGVETRRIHVDKAIAVTTKPRSSASGSAARCAASPPRSAARCAAAPRSNRSLGTSRPSTGWGAIISKGATAIGSTPRSPLPATTSLCSCAGSRGFCAPCCGCCLPSQHQPKTPN